MDDELVEEFEQRRALEQLADRLRLVMVRLRLERYALTAPVYGDYGGDPLPWEQLTESEKNQWRDHARACQEVMS
jgi:hypothetical protein